MFSIRNQSDSQLISVHTFLLFTSSSSSETNIIGYWTCWAAPCKYISFNAIYSSCISWLECVSTYFIKAICNKLMVINCYIGDKIRMELILYDQLTECESLDVLRHMRSVRNFTSTGCVRCLLSYILHTSFSMACVLGHKWIFSQSWLLLLLLLLIWQWFEIKLSKTGIQPIKIYDRWTGNILCFIFITSIIVNWLFGKVRSMKSGAIYELHIR